MKLVVLNLLLLWGAYSYGQLPKIENNQLVLETPVSFKAGTSELTDEGKEALKPVKEFLLAKDYISLLRVEGHTDNSGQEADLQKLSEQRAMSVCRWLVSSGIDCKRLIAVGFGSTKPVAANNSAEGKAANRRMVFALASLRGWLIGGMPADGGGAVAGDVCKTD
jgi:OOP family OmpA-OmpF porin